MVHFYTYNGYVAHFQIFSLHLILSYTENKTRNVRFHKRFIIQPIASWGWSSPGTTTDYKLIAIIYPRENGCCERGWVAAWNYIAMRSLPSPTQPLTPPPDLQEFFSLELTTPHCTLMNKNPLTKTQGVSQSEVGSLKN